MRNRGVDEMARRRALSPGSVPSQQIAETMDVASCCICVRRQQPERRGIYTLKCRPPKRRLHEIGAQATAEPKCDPEAIFEQEGYERESTDSIS